MSPQPDLFFKPLSDSQLKLIDKEIEAVQMNVDEEVKKLIEWINEQPHLPKYTGTEHFIRNFLHNKKYSIELCKNTIDRYYSVRNLIPELFANRDALTSSIQHIFDTVCIGYLPKLTEEGYRVIFIYHCEPELCIVEDFYSLIFMVLDLCLLEDYNRGLILCSDLSLISLPVMLQNTPLLVKKFMYYFLQCYPGRIKGFLICNAPSFFGYIGNLIRSLMPEKIKQRYHIHSSEEGYEPILKLVGKENCPKEYGGDCGNLQDLRENCKRKVIEYRDWFMKAQYVKTDESKRLISEADVDSLFGTTGSFRKLTLD